MRVTVNVTRRPEIADPQGRTVARALGQLGHDEVRSVRIDRTIHLEVEGDDRDQVTERVEEMCQAVLTNPVLEDYDIEVHE